MKIRKNYNSVKLLLGLAALAMLMTACDSGQTVKRDALPSTNLSGVNIGGLVIGANADEAYLAEGISVETNTEVIVHSVRYSVNDGGATPFSVNGTDSPRSIDEIVALLGQNHNDYWFDREQSVKAYTYYDGESEIYATFAFDNNSKVLVWVILSAKDGP